MTAQDGTSPTLKPAEHIGEVFEVVGARDAAGKFGPQVALQVKGGHVAYVSAKSGIAKGLNMMTVAECVETPEEAAMLRHEGVNFLQGYYFGVPTLEKPWIVPARPLRAKAAGGAAS